MAYTHDKYGKPIPPQVLEILNKPVPLKKTKKKRTASMAVSVKSGFSGMDANQVPPIHDVPDLYSTKGSRKNVCQRVPCERSESPLQPVISGGSTEEESDTSSDTLSDCSENLTEPTVSESNLSPLSWLRSMFHSSSSLTFTSSSATSASTISLFKQEEKTQTPVQNDFPERSGCKVPLETFSITEKPGVASNSRSRAPRANSNFYRILALENAMCLKGKLETPNVSMFLQPRSEPCEPHCVLGIQQKLRRSGRRWRELTDQDFQ